MDIVVFYESVNFSTSLSNNCIIYNAISCLTELLRLLYLYNGISICEKLVKYSELIPWIYFTSFFFLSKTASQILMRNNSPIWMTTKRPVKHGVYFVSVLWIYCEIMHYSQIADILQKYFILKFLIFHVSKSSYVYCK